MKVNKRSSMNLDGLIDAGFKGVKSLEPMASMDLKHLKETYGEKLCLIENIFTMISATKKYGKYLLKL